jgi:hypothetical protein
MCWAAMIWTADSVKDWLQNGRASMERLMVDCNITRTQHSDRRLSGVVAECEALQFEIDLFEEASVV